MTVRHILDHLNYRDLAPGLEVGTWQDFVPDPGWTNNTLRYRLVPMGLQLEGSIAGPLPPNATGRIGILPVGFRPARRQRGSGIVTVGLSYAFGFVTIEPDGGVFTWWSAADAASSVSVSMVVGLD